MEIHEACAGFGSAPCSVGRGDCCRCAVRILRRGFRSALDRERGAGREKDRGSGFDQERSTGSDEERTRGFMNERSQGPDRESGERGGPSGCMTIPPARSGKLQTPNPKSREAREIPNPKS
jgi:hypothetical protein